MEWYLGDLEDCRKWILKAFLKDTVTRYNDWRFQRFGRVSPSSAKSWETTLSSAQCILGLAVAFSSVPSCHPGGRMKGAQCPCEAALVTRDLQLPSFSNPTPIIVYWISSIRSSFSTRLSRQVYILFHNL